MSFLSSGLSAAGLRFLAPPTPAGDLGSPYGSLAGRSDQTPSGLSRFTFLRDELRVPCFTPGGWCVARQVCQPDFLPRTQALAVFVWGGSDDASNARSCPELGSSFPCLLLSSWRVSTQSWAFTLCTRTPPLPATLQGYGNTPHTGASGLVTSQRSPDGAELAEVGYAPRTIIARVRPVRRHTGQGPK